MVYEKQTWENYPSENTPITAERLNHLETQYDEAELLAQETLSESKNYTDSKLSQTNLPSGVNPLYYSDARPEGSLWPQGLSWDPSELMWYISMSGSVSGQDVIRIERRSESGTLIDFKQFPSPAFAEGLPFWKDVSGNLIFLVRAEAGNGSYSLFNYTSGVLGPPVPLPFPMHKSFMTDTSVWFTDASGAGGGVRFFYEFDLDSIKESSPKMVNTVELEHRNMYHKMQSFAVGEDGRFWISMGVPEDPPVMATYSRQGALQGMKVYEKPSFGEMINTLTPGFIKDLDNFGQEPEGLTFKNGVLVSGHVVSDYEPTVRRYYLAEHTDSGFEVKYRWLSDPQNTPVQDLPISNTANYELASPDVKIGICRRGDIVEIKGAVRTLTSTWQGIRLAVVPVGFRPRVTPGYYSHVTAVGTSVSPDRFYIQVSEAGNVWLNHWGPSPAAAGQWLGIHVVYTAA